MPTETDLINGYKRARKEAIENETAGLERKINWHVREPEPVLNKLEEFKDYAKAAIDAEEYAV